MGTPSPLPSAGQQMTGPYGSNVFPAHAPPAEHHTVSLYNSLLPSARVPPASGPHARSVTLPEVRLLDSKP